MTNLITLIEDFTTAWNDVTFIIDFVLSVLLIAVVTVYICYQSKRGFVYVFYIVLDVLFIVGTAFGMEMMQILSMVFLAVGTIILGVINSGMLRKYIAPSLKHNKLVKTEQKKESKYKDKDKFVSDMTAAVRWLSENKVGALITIEKDTPLDDWIKSGTIINCPFTPEIVETIFYEGTRLHDGAIIVRGDTIVAAAVYYQPSTKAVPGKFGARHRAALGISEVSDSITVLVSEETGRISIMHGGLIDNIRIDEFESSFLASISD